MNARMMYEELVDDLRRRREQAGGKLDQATEQAIAGELDIYWRMMGEEDRSRIEIILERHERFSLSPVERRSPTPQLGR